MTENLFALRFDLQDGRLDRLGNPLVELECTINWDALRKILKRIYKKARKSKKKQEK